MKKQKTKTTVLSIILFIMFSPLLADTNETEKEKIPYEGIFLDIEEEIIFNGEILDIKTTLMFTSTRTDIYEFDYRYSFSTKDLQSDIVIRNPEEILETIKQEEAKGDEEFSVDIHVRTVPNESTRGIVEYSDRNNAEKVEDYYRSRITFGIIPDPSMEVRSFGAIIKVPSGKYLNYFTLVIRDILPMPSITYQLAGYSVFQWKNPAVFDSKRIYLTIDIQYRYELDLTKLLRDLILIVIGICFAESWERILKKRILGQKSEARRKT